MSGTWLAARLCRTPSATSSPSSSWSSCSLSSWQQRNDCFEFHEGANEFMVGWCGLPQRPDDFKRLPRLCSGSRASRRCTTAEIYNSPSLIRKNNNHVSVAIRPELKVTMTDRRHLHFEGYRREYFGRIRMTVTTRQVLFIRSRLANWKVKDR